MSLDKILNELDAEKAKAIRAELDANYIGKNVAHEDPELINKIWGKQKGSYETKLKRLAKTIDENLIASNEIDELGFDKGLETAFERIKATKADLETKVKNSGKPDTELQKRLDETENKYKKTLEDYQIVDKSAKEMQNQLLAKDQEFSQFKINLFIDEKRKEALSKVQFTDTLQGAAREYAIKGFLDSVNAKYKVEPDGEELRIIDNTTGQRVHKDNKFLGLEEIYIQEANAAGLLKVSNGVSLKEKVIFAQQSKPDADVNHLGLKFKGHR